MNSKRKYAVLFGVIFTVAIASLVLLSGTMALASNIIDFDFLTFFPLILNQQAYVEPNREVWTLKDHVSVDWSTGGLTSASYTYSFTCVEFYCPEFPQDRIWGFHPTTREVEIQAINLLVLRKDGTGIDSISLTFEVRNFEGQIQHVVSETEFELLTAPIKEWSPATLTSVQGNLILSSGEYLAIHAHITGVPVQGEDEFFTLNPAFEVIVRDTGN